MLASMRGFGWFCLPPSKPYAPRHCRAPHGAALAAAFPAGDLNWPGRCRASQSLPSLSLDSKSSSLSKSLRGGKQADPQGRGVHIRYIYAISHRVLWPQVVQKPTSNDDSRSPCPSKPWWPGNTTHQSGEKPCLSKGGCRNWASRTGAILACTCGVFMGVFMVSTGFSMFLFLLLVTF